jgi:hypothetical protein
LIYWLMCELQNCLARRVPTASMTGIILQ